MAVGVTSADLNDRPGTESAVVLSSHRDGVTRLHLSVTRCVISVGIPCSCACVTIVQL